MDKKRIYNNLKKLVAIPGISGTESEAEVPAEIVKLLLEIPYFVQNPGNVKTIPLINDPLNRSIVVAFAQVHPEKPDTVILTGHYDVVDVEEFGHLQDIAFDVEEVTKRINEMPLDADSLKDFESGEWLFGRGVMDMKYGHALNIELLRHYIDNPKEINGNLLYVAVCGEETNSEGMLRAVPFFNDFAKEKGIDYKALLLPECFIMEDQANDTNRYIHYGSSGKVMPMFFFVGESTHFGEPFLGIDPTLMSNELYRRLELNTDFCQQAHGATTPPPVCIKMKDLKGTYSASIPLYSVAYYTMVTVDLDPEKMINDLIKLAEESMQSAIDFVNSKASKYDKLTGEKTIKYEYSPCVITYGKLLKEVEKTFDGDLKEHLKAYAKEEIGKKQDLQDVAISIVKHTYELYKEKKPMIILSIIPPYYPDSYIPKDEPNTATLMKACDEVIQYAEEKYGESLKMKNWYMGISDMCYSGLADDKNFDSLFENLAGIDIIYQLPEESLKKFKVPGIVLGGYGKDFHKHTERLNKHYNFDVLPDLYVHIINKILK